MHFADSRLGEEEDKQMNKDKEIEALMHGHLSIPVIILDKYEQVGLNETEAMMLLHIYRFGQNNVPLPTPKELAEKMSMDENECAGCLRSMIKRNLLQIDEFERDQIRQESYSLYPFFRQALTAEAPSGEGEQIEEQHLFQNIEQEFSRPLSPMEWETINVWLDQDHYSPDMIQIALKEAVMNQKFSLRYMDRMLHEWKRKGIQTKEDAKAQTEQFKQKGGRRTQAAQSEKLPEYPNINWLDEE